MLVYECFGTKYEDVHVSIGHYADGNLCVSLFNSEGAILTASVNLPESLDLEANQFYCKEWSENEGVGEWLEANGIATRLPGTEAKTGFVSAERFELTSDYMK